MLAVAGSVRAQDATQPPPAQHAVLTLQGRGVQIYTCQSSGQWVFVAPAARLFDASGAEVGTHGDGPVWHSQDGSSVHGQAVAKAPSPDAGSVPWLLLKAVAAKGPGVFSTVEYIRRSDTKGGVAPSSGCDAENLGKLEWVPYTATYTFYSSK